MPELAWIWKGYEVKKVELSVERVLTKLNEMLQKRFGVTAAYLPLYGGDKQHKATLETVKRNSGAPMILARNELIVPIRVDGVLAGATKVDDINGLPLKDISQIKETIDLVMTEVIAARRRIEILSITEDILRGETGNVISLGDRRLAPPREVVSH
jgi:hypothetical protein